MRDSERAEAVAALIPDAPALRAACVRAAANGAPWAGIAAHAVELAAEAVERCEGVPDRYADRAAWRVDGVRDFLRRAGYYGKGDESPAPGTVARVAFDLPGGKVPAEAADDLFAFLRTTIGAPEPYAAEPCPYRWRIESAGGHE